MIKTPHLGLNVTDERTPSADADILFRHFRRQLAGNMPQSNMHILDAELRRMANQISQLRGISSSGARFYVRAAGPPGNGVFQVVNDNVNPYPSQVRASDTGIEDIEPGEFVMRITLDADGMAELLDIRNSVRGEIHASAGDAVRAVEQSVLDLENGVNLNGTRARQDIESYEDGEISLLPGTRYFLHNIPAQLTIVLDDTHAAPDISQEFTFVLNEQIDAYTIEVEYFSGAGIRWHSTPNFVHNAVHFATVIDGHGFVFGQGGTIEPQNRQLDGSWPLDGSIILK